MKRELFSIAFVVLAIVLFCRGVLLEGASPFRGDIPLQFHPWKVYTQQMLAQGETPYWNPHTFAGAPFMANLQSAVFYPLDWILYPFSDEAFFGYSLLLHLLLGALGCYCLARMCGANPLPAIVAGVAYGLNGFVMIHIPAGNHLTYAGAAWAPWLFLAAAGFVLPEKGKYAWALVAVLITTLHFLCGHPQMAFYSLVFSTLFCLALSIWKQVKIEGRSWTHPLRRAFLFGLFILWGLAMAGAQLLPTLEYLEHANRAASISLEKATEFSFAPHRLVTLFFPEYFGTKGVVALQDNHFDPFYYWSNAYAGAMVPLLALAAVLKRPRLAAVLPLAGVGVIALVLACGRENPIYALVYQLPGFGYFRAPAKFLPYYLVPVCVLAALGIERLAAQAFERQQTNPSPLGQLKWSLGLGVMLIIILTAGAIGVPPLYQTIRQADGITEQWLISGYSMAIGGFMLLAGTALWQFAAKAAKPRFALALGMAMLLCLDLFTFGSAYLNNNLYSPQQIRRMTAAPQEIGYLNSQAGLQPGQRVATLGDLPYPNYAFLWRFKNLAGYDPMNLQSYVDAVGVMEGWDDDRVVDNVQLKRVDHPVLDKLNVRFILTAQRITHENLQPIFHGSEFFVYERTSNQRAYLARSNADSRDPAKIENWQPIPNNAVRTYQPHRIEIDLNGIAGGWLRLAEWHYPGWRAVVAIGNEERRPTPIHPTQDGLRAIHLPESAQSLILTYEAPWNGFWLSLAASGLFAVTGFLYGLYLRGKLFFFLSRLMGRYY